MVQNGSKWFNLGSISILTPIMSYLLSYISDLYDYLCKIKYTKSIFYFMFKFFFFCIFCDQLLSYFRIYIMIRFCIFWVHFECHDRGLFV